FSTYPASEQSKTPAAKRRKVGGQRPLMSSGEVTTHKFCTYCGINLASELGAKVNVKRHLALKHSAHLCIEMGAVVNDEADGVCSKAFLKHIDKVDHIYNSLKSHGYKVVPACNFFELNNTDMLPKEASSEEKEAFFHEFFTEARSAFFKYQVIYLKGITIPEKYEDLMKMDANSNYDSVNWKDGRPSGSNFSLNKLTRTAEEDSEHALDIKSQFTSLVLGWV
ncbi:SsrA-binding protein, partial [Frankliniella fusca]